jgi:hypothetical protein
MEVNSLQKAVEILRCDQRISQMALADWVEGG